MIELIQGDCTDYMATLPDKAFDLAIVDPPYGININMNMGLRKGKRKKRVDKDWDNSIPSDDYFQELTRVSVNQIIWGGNYFPQLPIYNPKLKRLVDFKKVNGIIWAKGLTMYGRDFNEAEIAYSTLGPGFIELSPVQAHRFHPTQKPVALYKWLLHNYASPGDRILDTHLGSASSAIAAHQMGFDFVGIELDKDYYAAACKRFKEQTAQLKLL